MRNKHGSPDKSTIINTIAPSPSSPSHPLLHHVLIHEESSPLEGVPRSYRFIAMHRTASRPFDPSPTLCHLPSLTHGLFITTWPGFSRQLRDRILARKGRRGEGGKRARGRMVRVAECRVQLYQYPTRCRQGLRLAAWFTLRLCTVFVRMVCTKVILFSAVDEFTWRDGSMSYFANGTKGKLDLNELKGAWQRLAWRVFPRWCNSGMVLLEQVDG